MAANPIYVHEGYTPLSRHSRARIASLKVGHGLEPTTDIGTMTKLSVAQKCRAQISDAIAAGARVFCPKQVPSPRSQLRCSNAIQRCRRRHADCAGETFGPVAAVLRFDSEEEAIARANVNEMGLAGYVYTNSPASGTSPFGEDRVRHARRQYSLVHWTAIPFGGWKQSGLGREGSRHGLADYICNSNDISEVARRNGVSRGLLTVWRRQVAAAVAGKAPNFVPIQIGAGSGGGIAGESERISPAQTTSLEIAARPAKPCGVIEIEVSGARIRVEPG
ncbi:aldehyde dehydrogenase family protein, partial [Bradyrhizobium sp. 188]|nr:aldehyde dehydrogenase family protein [Bradyrhizobium sp. 188]